MSDDVLARMTAALADLESRWKGRRRPKAFYLSADDWSEFEATNPPRIATIWRNVPATEPSVMGVPVRPSDSVESRLYDHTTTGRPIARGRVKPGTTYVPLAAEDVFATLDAISRTRALTEGESLALEAAMKGRAILSNREAARLGIKRRTIRA